MNAARAILLALLLCWPFAVRADVAVPRLSGRVVDQTGTLSASDIDALTQKLKDLEQRKGSQVAVLIVPTTQPETIEQFSIRVAEAWKIGRKKTDDGALIVVAKNDRRLRIEVGYGLEGALPDVTANRIINEIITPRFRAGDFAGGITDGVDRMIRVIDGEPLPAPSPPRQTSGSEPVSFDSVDPFFIIPVILFGSFARGVFGRLLGALISGAVVTLVGGYLFGSWIAAALAGVIAGIFVMFAGTFITPMPVGRGGRGGWVVGSSGGSWSGGFGSGSSGGGFSGGGGNFGGGGASGSW